MEISRQNYWSGLPFTSPGDLPDPEIKSRFNRRQILYGLSYRVKSYNGSVANANENYIIVMACDNASRIDCFIKVMKKYSPVQIVRSGSVMMEI